MGSPLAPTLFILEEEEEEEEGRGGWVKTLLRLLEEEDGVGGWEEGEESRAPRVWI